jgi:hypothetical protein
MMRMARLCAAQTGSSRRRDERWIIEGGGSHRPHTPNPGHDWRETVVPLARIYLIYQQKPACLNPDQCD